MAVLETVFAHLSYFWPQAMVHEAEAYALLTSLQLAHSQGFDHVIFESDSKIILDANSGLKHYCIELGLGVL
ncbi:hypothetical protein L195_g014823, partial [Trifolium pratense]